MQEKKERMLNAIRLWCLTKGLEEIDDNKNYYTDIAFKKDEKATGFIFEFDKDEKLLKSKITNAKSVCNYIYVVIDDSKKRKEISDKIPKDCGIWGYSNSFGVGYVCQVLKSRY